MSLGSAVGVLDLGKALVMSVVGAGFVVPKSNSLSPSGGCLRHSCVPNMASY